MSGEIGKPGAHEPGSAAADPSMDDILASIRRILDEEGTRAAAPADGPEPTVHHAPAAPADPVLELDTSMMLPEPDEAAAGPIPTPPPILMEPVAAEPAYYIQDLPRDPVLPPPVAPALLAPMPGGPPPTLVAPDLVRPDLMKPGLVAPAAAAAASSVGALLRTLASERTTATSRQGPTIEDLVREEMRPLLKEWLDTHLPPLVERLVRAEIERVVSRGP